MASLEPTTYTDDHDPAILPPAREWGAKGAQIRYLAEKYPEMSRASIARRVECDPARVTQVLNEFLHDTGVEGLRNFQGNQADIYDAIRYRTLLSLTPDKLSKASALQLATTAAILHDKAALCRGQATSITAVALLDVAQLMRQQMDGGE